MKSKIFQEVLNETPKEVDKFVRVYATGFLKIKKMRYKKKELQRKLNKTLEEISENQKMPQLKFESFEDFMKSVKLPRFIKRK